MKIEKITHNGFEIHKRVDVKMHTCLIYKGEELIKCIAGAIFPDGSENSIEKAKNYIDSNLIT